MLLPTISTALIVLATVSVLFVANWLVWGAGVFAGEDTELRTMSTRKAASSSNATHHTDDGFRHVA